MNGILAYEPMIRLAAFGLIFMLMVAWEFHRPFREQRVKRRVRWTANLSLLLLNSLLVRVLFPVAAVGAALYAEENSLGVFHYFSVNELVLVIISWLILDVVIYWQHRLFHRVPILWRLHQVHHIDPDIDITTGTRFHPIEIILSMLIKIGVVMMFGLHPVGVLLFEVLLNGAAMFNHSNVDLPKWLERKLSGFWVTPRVHRVHHSVKPSELNQNFGFSFSVWDRLFGSYNSGQHMNQVDMKIGTESHYNKPDSSSEIKELLATPFKKQ